MDNDLQAKSGPQEQPDQERQNRRQFFNGLGKWSLAVIAAIVALRDGVDDVRDGTVSRFGTGSDAAGDPRLQIAMPRHGNSHGNALPEHGDVHGDHANHCNGPFRDRGCGGSAGPA